MSQGEAPVDAGPHVVSITYSCVAGGITGQVVVSNDGDEPWSGTINFYLTQHFPGGSSWSETGDFDDVDFVDVPVNGTQTMNYSMGWNPDPSANSTRVENDLDTTKSDSFTCGDPQPTSTDTMVPPTSTSTLTDTPVPPTATNTDTPVPPTPTNTSVSPTDTGTPQDPTETSTGTLIPSDTPTGTLPAETETGTPPANTDTPEPSDPPDPTASPTQPGLVTGGGAPGGGDGVGFVILGLLLLLVGGGLGYRNRRFAVR